MDRKAILLMLSLTFLFGCKESNVNEIYFTENIDNLKTDSIEIKTLSGCCIISDRIGIEGIGLTDNYIILTYQDTDSLIGIYDVTGKEVMVVGKRGQGPNDFINTVITGQHGDNNHYIWINDVSMSLLKRVNIDLTIASKKCVVDQQHQTLPRSANAFSLSDSSIISEEMTEDNYVLERMTKDGETILKEKMYKFNIPGPFSYYKSSMCINEAQSTLCAAMHSVNQVNFYNYSTRDRKSVTIGNVATKDKIVTNIDTGIPDWVYYASTYATPNYFYCLYLDQCYEDAYEKGKNTEIHVFTPTGNLIRIIKLDKYIISFSVNDSDDTLYGIYEDSAIYKYNLTLN